MHYTYVLLSRPDKRMYTGSTKDLRTRAVPPFVAQSRCAMPRPGLLVPFPVFGGTSWNGNRVRKHAEGRVRSTAYRRPMMLIYYEACLSAGDALRRERFLKTGKGKRYLRNRLASFFAGIRGKKLERY